MSSLPYQTFIGIDIGKYQFVVACHNQSKADTFDNNPRGHQAFYQHFKSILKHALVILETTGGYELPLILFLHTRQVKLHRANTRQVKAFIRSLGQLAKTDRLDALALAHYGEERYTTLPLFQVHKQALTLHELAQRQLDLKKMLVQEKNRYQAPRANDHIQASCQHLINLLNQEIETLNHHIQAILDKDTQLKSKQRVLENMTGIGATTARALLCLMPELGTLTRRQVASLAGLAPHPYESGTYRGQRHIKGGRKDVRNALFMAALSAIRAAGPLQVFYQRLINNGKKPMVAVTAVMRKMIVIANARIKENNNLSNLKTT